MQMGDDERGPGMDVLSYVRPSALNWVLGVPCIVAREHSRTGEADLGVGKAMLSVSDLSQPLERYIEHTLLKPDATEAQIIAHCREAAELGLLAVCVSPAWVSTAAQVLRGTSVLVDTTCGFPLGSETTTIKVAEAINSLRLGAGEIDMVMNIGALKSGLYDWVQQDMAQVAMACHARGAKLKVILEMGYLSDAEKVNACELAADAGVDFVKTATGFGPGGATIADVELMRRSIRPGMGVKAAGGIRDLATALAMIEAGADRIGTSAGASIVRLAREL